MGEIVKTHLLTPESVAARGVTDREQIYNCLDCCLTVEILGALQRLSNQAPLIYDFERALQGPILEIMLRGFRVNTYERRRAQESLRAILLTLGGDDSQYKPKAAFVGPTGILQRYAFAIWGKPLNPNSHKQLKEFFYGHLRISEIWTSKKGERKLSMDRESLEKISANWLAMPIVSAILAIREHQKSLQTLDTEIDPDGRFRTSLNIAATETGRLSSSKNAFGTGGNLQNWKQRLRRPFESDIGWKMGAIDLEQAESREIGFLLGILFNDWTYLDAVEAGDLHTFTARLVWPELPWNGDLKKDREIAERSFYRDFTFRDMSKRGGHGLTYVGTPWTMSRHLKVAVKVIEVFQERFFNAFPGIPRLHRWTAQELQTTHQLETYFGRVRHFFGRPDDDATLREGVAFLGQSPTADRMNTGMLRLWEGHRGRIRLLTQLHDAVYYQFREGEDEAEIAAIVRACCEITVHAPNGRAFCVPGEIKSGWNWANAHDPKKPLHTKKNPFNPDGMMKFKGEDSRKRLVGMEAPI